MVYYHCRYNSKLEACLRKKEFYKQNPCRAKLIPAVWLPGSILRIIMTDSTIPTLVPPLSPSAKFKSVYTIRNKALHVYQYIN